MARPPVSPNDAAVFRRRRIIVLALAVLLIYGIFVAISAGVSAVSSALGIKAPSSTAAATPGKPTTCAKGVVSVQAFIGDGKSPKSTFVASEKPYIWFNLTNNGSVPCYLNVGTNQQSYKITSGSELIWTSRDCIPYNGSDSNVLMPVGETKTSPASYWDKVHSSVNGCGATTESPVVTGGASYHLQITVDGNVSNDVQFILN